MDPITSLAPLIVYAEFLKIGNALQITFNFHKLTEDYLKKIIIMLHSSRGEHFNRQKIDTSNYEMRFFLNNQFTQLKQLQKFNVISQLVSFYLFGQGFIDSNNVIENMQKNGVVGSNSYNFDFTNLADNFNNDTIISNLQIIFTLPYAGPHLKRLREIIFLRSAQLLKIPNRTDFGSILTGYDISNYDEMTEEDIQDYEAWQDYEYDINPRYPEEQYPVQENDDWLNNLEEIIAQEIGTLNQYQGMGIKLLKNK